jgi:hypothetical protein
MAVLAAARPCRRTSESARQSSGAAVRRAADSCTPEYCTQSTVLRRPHPVRDRPGPVLSDDARCTHAPSHRAAKSTCPPGVLTHFRRRRALWFRTTRNVGAGHAREVNPHSGRRSQLVLQRCVLPCCSAACGAGGPTAQVAEARINTLQVLPRATGALCAPRPRRPASSTHGGYASAFVPRRGACATLATIRLWSARPLLCDRRIR